MLSYVPCGQVVRYLYSDGIDQLWTCFREKGHHGPHKSGAEGSYVHWTDLAATKRIAHEGAANRP